MSKYIRTYIFCLVEIIFCAISVQAANYKPEIRDVPSNIEGGKILTLGGNNLLIEGNATIVTLKWEINSMKCEYPAEIISLKSASLVATVPELDYDGNMKIVVANNNGEAAVNVQYKSNLIINDIKAASEKYDGDVVMIGKGFLRKDSAGKNLQTTVMINWIDSGNEHTLMVKADPQSDTSLVFKLPKFEQSGSLDFKIKVGEKISDKITKEKNELVKISSVSAEILRVEPDTPIAGETITVIGKNFKVRDENNIIVRSSNPRGEMMLTQPVKISNVNAFTYLLPPDLENYEKISIAIKNKDSEESNKYGFAVARRSKKIEVDFRVGLQSSTYSEVENNDGKLFHGNSLFYELVTHLKICNCSGIEAKMHAGRKLVEGEKSGANTDAQTIIANAEIVKGEMSIYWVHEYGFYVRPAATFIATIDNEIKDDFYNEKYIGVGYKPCSDKNDKFNGSKFEVGLGYTDALEYRSRFISNLRLVYHPQGISTVPFIDFKIDTGKGPDDMTVFYGIDLNIDKIFESIQGFFAQ